MKNPEETVLYPVWKELVKVARSWDFGTFHSHQEIADILGVESQCNKYYNHVQSARHELIRAGQIWNSYKSKGYFIVEANDHPEAAFDEVLKVRKHSGLYLMKSQYAPVERMDKQAKDKTEIARVKARGLYDMTDKTCIEMNRVLKPIPKKFQIKEAKPMEENTNEDN